MRVMIMIPVLIFALGVSVQLAESNPVINDADAPQFLYTMSAKSGTFKDGVLTLKDVPLVVYFSDRPHRISGMLSLEVFAQGWDQGPDSFKADPPNGTLSILEGAAGNAVVELSNPNADFKKGIINFDVRVLAGEIPGSFDHATLFVDGGVIINL